MLKDRAFVKVDSALILLRYGSYFCMFPSISELHSRGQSICKTQPRAGKSTRGTLQATVYCFIPMALNTYFGKVAVNHWHPQEMGEGVWIKKGKMGSWPCHQSPSLFAPVLILHAHVKGGRVWWHNHAPILSFFDEIVYFVQDCMGGNQQR